MPEIVYIFFGERTETISGSKMPAGLLLRARTYHLSFDHVGFLFRFFLRFLLGDQQVQHAVFIYILDNSVLSWHHKFGGVKRASLPC